MTDWKEFIREKFGILLWSHQQEILARWSEKKFLISYLPPGNGRSLLFWSIAIAPEHSPMLLVVPDQTDLLKRKNQGRELAVELSTAEEISQLKTDQNAAITYSLFTQLPAETISSFRTLILDNPPTDPPPENWLNRSDSTPPTLILSDLLPSQKYWWSQLQGFQVFHPQIYKVDSVSWMAPKEGEEKFELKDLPDKSWIFGQISASEIDGNEQASGKKQFVQIPNEGSERAQLLDSLNSTASTLFVMPEGALPPYKLPTPAVVLYRSVPSSLAHLTVTARRSKTIIIPQPSEGDTLPPEITRWYSLKKKAARTALLWQTAELTPHPEIDLPLSELLQYRPQTAEFWTKLSEIELKDPFSLAARSLLLFKDAPDVATVLWELFAHNQSLKPAIDSRQFLQYLPPAEELPETPPSALLQLLQQFLKSSSEGDETEGEEALIKYLLKIPKIKEYYPAIGGFINRFAEKFLEKEAKESITERDELLIKLAQKLRKAFKSKEVREGKEGRLPYSKPWELALAWYNTLQGKNYRDNWHIADRVHKKSPFLYRIRAAQISLQHHHPERAYFLLERELERVKERYPELHRKLKKELFSLCKSQPRCRDCPLYKSSYCPSSLTRLIRDVVRRISTAEEDEFYRIAKRLRANISSLSPEYLRELLSSELAQKSERIKRAILHLLAQREKADKSELKQLAEWSFNHGDLRNALLYREQLSKLDPEDGENLRELAYLYLKQGDIEIALSTALQAAHIDPQKYPLQTWVQQHLNALLQKSTELRSALISTPAHPAFQYLEEQLNEYEKLLQQIKPQLEELEKAYSSENYGKAKSIADKITEFCGEKTPHRVLKILEEIRKKELELKKQFRKIPADPKRAAEFIEKLLEKVRRLQLLNLVDDLYSKLCELEPDNPQHYFQWAKASRDPAHKGKAFRKAIELATKKHRYRYLEEYLRYLESLSLKPEELLELVRHFLEKYGEEIIPTVDRFLSQWAEKISPGEKVLDELRSIVAPYTGGTFRKLREFLRKFDSLEPWKRKLLSFKSE